MPIVPKNQKTPSDQAYREEVQPRARVRLPDTGRSIATSDTASGAVANPTASPISASSAYEVGYKKPPKHTRFQPGISGNKKGRPKGAKGLKTLVREVMTEKVVVRTSAGSRKMTRAEALVLKQMESAFSDNDRARQAMLNLYASAVPDDQILPAASSNDESTLPSTTEEISEVDQAILDEFRATVRSETRGEK